jgi:hypothetical protein
MKTSRRRTVSEELMEGGQRGQDDPAIEPEEEDRQRQFASHGRQHGEPLITTSDRGDDVEPGVAQQQGPGDESGGRQNLSAEPRRPRRVAEDTDECDIEADPEQVPVACVVARWEGRAEERHPGEHAHGHGQKEAGNEATAALGQQL